MTLLSSILPAFDWYEVILAPWTRDLALFGWVMLMAFLVTATCGWIGNYLLLRRLALVGDAISHSVLPGLVIAYLIFGSLSIGVMIGGAVAAGLLTTVLIEFIHTHSRIKADAAIGITFCSLFALGVLLINLYANQVHLDAECVLYGELTHIQWAPGISILGVTIPQPILHISLAAVMVLLLTLVFYKEMLLCSFDPALAASHGFRPQVMHYGLMATLSLVIVTAFESVGAILVIAMLILPAATAQLLSTRLPHRLLLSVLHAFIPTRWMLAGELRSRFGRPDLAALVLSGPPL
jgi:manganese/zinc/iron transport system permease protein